MDSLLKVSMYFSAAKVRYPDVCLNFPHKEHVTD